MATQQAVDGADHAVETEFVEEGAVEAVDVTEVPAKAPAKRTGRVTHEGRLADARAAREEALAERAQAQKIGGLPAVIFLPALPPLETIERPKRGPFKFTSDYPEGLKPGVATAQSEVRRTREDAAKAVLKSEQMEALQAQKLRDSGIALLRGHDTLEHAGAYFHAALEMDGPPDTLLDLAHAACTRNLSEAEDLFLLIIEKGKDKVEMPKAIPNGHDAPQPYTPDDLIAGAHVGLAGVYLKQLAYGADLNGHKLSEDDKLELMAGIEQHYCKDAKRFSGVRSTSPVHVLFADTANQLSYAMGQWQEATTQRFAARLEQTEGRLAVATAPKGWRKWIGKSATNDRG